MLTPSKPHGSDQHTIYIVDTYLKHISMRTGRFIMKEKKECMHTFAKVA